MSIVKRNYCSRYSKNIPKIGTKERFITIGLIECAEGSAQVLREKIFYEEAGLPIKLPEGGGA